LRVVRDHLLLSLKGILTIVRLLDESGEQMQRIEQKTFGAHRQCDGNDPREVLAFLKWVQQAAGNSAWEVTTEKYDARDDAGNAGTAMITPLENKLKNGIIGIDGKTENDGAISLEQFKLLSTLKKDREIDLKMQANTDDKATEIMRLMMEGSKGNLKSAIATIHDQQGNIATNTSRKKMNVMLKKVKDDYCGTADRRNTTTQVDAEMKRQSVATTADDVRSLVSNLIKLREEWDGIYQSGIAHYAQPPPDYHAMKHLLLERISFGDELTDVRRAVAATHNPATWEQLTSAISRVFGTTVMPLSNMPSATMSVGTATSSAAMIGSPAQVMAVVTNNPDNDRSCRLFRRTGACMYGKECRYLKFTPGHPMHDFQRGRLNAFDRNRNGRANDRSRSSSVSDHRGAGDRNQDRSRSRDRDRQTGRGRESQQRGRHDDRLLGQRDDCSDSESSRSCSRGSDRSSSRYNNLNPVAEARTTGRYDFAAAGGSRGGQAGGTPKKPRRS
jgi:hypothetical protein